MHTDIHIMFKACGLVFFTGPQDPSKMACLVHSTQSTSDVIGGFQGSLGLCLSPEEPALSCVCQACCIRTHVPSHCVTSPHRRQLTSQYFPGLFPWLAKLLSLLDRWPVVNKVLLRLGVICGYIMLQRWGLNEYSRDYLDPEA